jgi:hypothetical protein
MKTITLVAQGNFGLLPSQVNWEFDKESGSSIPSVRRNATTAYCAKGWLLFAVARASQTGGKLKAEARSFRSSSS